MKNFLDDDNDLDNHSNQKKALNINSDLGDPDNIEDEDFYSENLDDDDLVPNDESNFDIESDKDPESDNTAD